MTMGQEKRHSDNIRDIGTREETNGQEMRHRDTRGDIVTI